MRTGHFDPATGKWVDDAPPHEFPDSPADRVVEMGPDDLVRPVRQQSGIPIRGANLGLASPTLIAGNHGGLVEPGNIDLTNRPDTANRDGSHSSVRSMSFSDGGPEILVPTVMDDGRVVSEDDAIANYRKTGQHLGKFASVADADAYAQRLHQQQAGEFNTPPSADSQPTEMPQSLADKARAAKAFVLNKYAPAPNEAGPVTQESMDWAQRPDVQRANAAGRLEGGNGTYEDRGAVGLPIPQGQDQADANGFARFAGMGAAGELAAPLVARGVSSVADRARAMLAARQGTVRTGTDPGFLQPVEVGPTRPADFWMPRDGDMGDQLFETPSTVEPTANIRLPQRPLNARGAIILPPGEEEK